jgi:hypothetical protein
MPHELASALADDVKQPMSILECTSSHSNSTFVDDNGVLALHFNIRGTLYNSVVAAFLLFGWPHEDRRSSCLPGPRRMGTRCMFYHALPVFPSLQPHSLCDLAALRTCRIIQ